MESERTALLQKATVSAQRGAVRSGLERVRLKGVAYECVTVWFCEGLGQWKGVVVRFGAAVWFVVVLWRYGIKVRVWHHWSGM